MIHKIDEKIVETVQAMYLWFYDWTGIYVATVATIALIFGKAIEGFSTDMISLLILAFNIVAMVPNYIQQDKKQFTVFNATALMLRGLTLRHILTGFMFGILITNVVTGNWRQGINCLMLTLYMYCTTVCIREREPKEWFPQRKLAWNASS